MVRIALAVLLLANSAVFSQTLKFKKIEGRIIDLKTKEGVPFASISLEGRPYGTSSNEYGYFTLISRQNSNPSDVAMLISCLGYKNLRLTSVSDSLVVELEPVAIQLKEVIVSARTLHPRKITEKAFKRIKKNYYTKPLLYKSFYRHYCKENSEYGRLIEAAVEIYKNKGHRIIQPEPGYKEHMRVTQLRRTYDNSSLKKIHVPIALSSVLACDDISYQKKKATKDFISDVMNFGKNVSILKRDMKRAEFSLEGITEYEGHEVYKISYKIPPAPIQIRHALHSGTLYINTRDYAIVKSERHKESEIDTINSITIYKKFGDRYFHHVTVKDGSQYYPKDNFLHKFHIELMTNEIVLKDIEKFKGKEPDRETLLKIDYDSLFWKQYNVLKSTPLEESIVSDLEKRETLDQQYVNYLAIERERFFGGKEDEEKFNEYLAMLRGKMPVYIDFWASWCGPCIREMPASKEVAEKFRGKVAFIYLSIDDNIEAWRKAVLRLGLNESLGRHFRIGENADAIKMFELREIPRYVLLNKDGTLANFNAKRPSNPDLSREIQKLIDDAAEK